MNLSRRLVRGGVSILAVAILFACSGSGSESGRDARSSAIIEEDQVLATIGDVSIRMADVRQVAGERLDQLENQYLRQRHEIVEETLEEMLNTRLLQDEAEKRGMTVYEMLDAEVDSKLAVTEQDIADWYAENQAQTRGRSLEEISSQIEQFLREKRKAQLTADLVQQLRTEQNVVYHLEPFRVDLDNEGSPAHGPEDAPVTLVEFSDFECPFCGSFFPTLKRLQKTYGDSLRIVYRQFPLPRIHPNAFKAAEASLCAHEQGKFWDMHDLLFAEQERLAVKDLKEKARRLGLDGEEFDTCLDTGRYVEQVQTDMEEGTAVGVTGTPALFVNGILVPGGAVPYDTVAEYIDEELERSGVEPETGRETAGR